VTVLKNKTTRLARPTNVIIPQIEIEYQTAAQTGTPSLEQLLEHELSLWAKRQDTEYARLQQLDAVLRRALDESENGKTDPDQHDDLVALSDCIHQRMTDIETRLKRGPDWLLDGGFDE
jgi:hypothetical protein